MCQVRCQTCKPVSEKLASCKGRGVLNLQLPGPVSRAHVLGERLTWKKLAPGFPSLYIKAKGEDGEHGWEIKGADPNPAYESHQAWEPYLQVKDHIKELSLMMVITVSLKFSIDH